MKAMPSFNLMTVRFGGVGVPCFAVGLQQHTRLLYIYICIYVYIYIYIYDIKQDVCRAETQPQMKHIYIYGTPPPRDLPFLKLVLLRLVSWGGGEIEKCIILMRLLEGAISNAPWGPKFSKYKWRPCTLSPGAPGGHLKVL